MTTLEILVRAGWEVIDKSDEGRAFYFVHPSSGRVREVYVRRSGQAKDRSLEDAAVNMLTFLDREEKRKDASHPAFK
jgi:hypothetical protein